MSPRSVREPALPAAVALARRTAMAIGAALRDERIRRGWSIGQTAIRARVSPGVLSGIEAGRTSSIDSYTRLAIALGLSMEVVFDSARRRRPSREPSDLVHAAMGDLEAGWLAPHAYHVAIDHPYQHYQFAGRADVLAWTLDPPALLHLENRTRFPDLQEAAGSYNAKRQYLASTVAREIGIQRFRTETHVMVGLWSSEVIHSVRLRAATFRALCPDPDDRFREWLRGEPPSAGESSSFVLLDPFARGRKAAMIGLEGVLSGAHARVRGYHEAAERLR